LRLSRQRIVNLEIVEIKINHSKERLRAILANRCHAKKEIATNKQKRKIER